LGREWDVEGTPLHTKSFVGSTWLKTGIHHQIGSGRATFGEKGRDLFSRLHWRNRWEKMMDIVPGATVLEVPFPSRKEVWRLRIGSAIGRLQL
jgi:hypothetical protein